MQVGDQETRSTQLDQVELALSEPGDNGIANQLSQFWNGWADLSNSPDDVAARQALIDQAKNLAASFQGVDAQLTTVKSQATAEYAALTGAGGDVVSTANEIATLNAAIKQFDLEEDQRSRAGGPRGDHPAACGESDREQGAHSHQEGEAVPVAEGLGEPVDGGAIEDTHSVR